MQKMHDATTEAESVKIETAIKNEFDSLTASEKERVRKEFITSWNEKLEETAEALKKIAIAIESVK